MFNTLFHNREKHSHTLIRAILIDWGKLLIGIIIYCQDYFKNWRRRRRGTFIAQVYSVWQWPPQIFTVALGGLSVLTPRKKLCHCSVCVCECVSGCTAVLLSTQARGLHSTGSVQRDGGMQETGRGRVEGCICVKVHGENNQFCGRRPHVILQIYVSFLPSSRYSLSSRWANISLLLSLTLGDYISTI